MDAALEEMDSRMKNGSFAHLNVRQNGVPPEYPDMDDRFLARSSLRSGRRL
jgi:hypothetical protein